MHASMVDTQSLLVPDCHLCLLLPQAAAASAAPPAAKGRGRASKGGKSAQPATGAHAAAAAAAAALLEDSSKLKLAGLVAVMGRLASAESLVGMTGHTYGTRDDDQLCDIAAM